MATFDAKRRITVQLSDLRYYPHSCVYLFEDKQMNTIIKQFSVLFEGLIFIIVLQHPTRNFF